MKVSAAALALALLAASQDPAGAEDDLQVGGRSRPGGRQRHRQDRAAGVGPDRGRLFADRRRQAAADRLRAVHLGRARDRNRAAQADGVHLQRRRRRRTAGDAGRRRRQHRRRPRQVGDRRGEAVHRHPEPRRSRRARDHSRRRPANRIHLQPRHRPEAARERGRAGDRIVGAGERGAGGSDRHPARRRQRDGGGGRPRVRRGSDRADRSRSASSSSPASRSRCSRPRASAPATR